jgi:arylsulfatase A-like enzyme
MLRPMLPVAFLVTSGCGADAEAPARPNVILIVLDTLRADRLGCYGGPRPTSPHLDALAAGGLLFAQARAPSPYTATSHASLFASLDPEVHGVWNKVQREGKTVIGDALSPNAVTLAESLRDAGYQTAAIADGGHVSERNGLDQGFQLFDSTTSGAVDRVARAIEWMNSGRDPGRPFFLFLHTYETHIPYMPDRADVERFAPEYRGRLRQAYEQAMSSVEQAGASRKHQDVHVRWFRPVLQSPDLRQADLEFFLALYDAEIALADREVGHLLAALDGAGLRDSTIVIVTSDHGEAFWEHGLHGHHQLYEQLLHVPLIVRAPGGPAGVRRPDLVGLVDLMPSLLALLGLPVPPTATGCDFGLLTPAPMGDRAYFAAANHPEEQQAARRGGLKWLLQSAPMSSEAVFDLHADLFESHDRSSTAAGAAFQREMRVAQAERQERLREHRMRYGLEAVLAADPALAGRAKELADLGYAGD